jgi:hypothetical protein
MEPGRNRRTKRMPIHWPTTLLEGDRRRPCTIMDVSRTGARIHLVEPVPPRSRITLLDDRVGALEAIVVWCRGNIAGVNFLEPAPSVGMKLRAVLQALEEAETRTALPRPRPQFGRRIHHGAVRK